MKSSSEYISIAGKVLEHESLAIKEVAARLDDNFLKALQILQNCTGKVIVTGLGKSGIAAKKISATLASTGTPALFLHAAEAVHGDMGVISAGDVAIALSYSGETQELIELLPRFKLLGVPVISLTGGKSSNMANLSDCVIDVSVPNYSFPYGIIPTASNAVTVAIGDALAITLLVSKGIKEEDFALLHPGGLLGKQMLVRVADLMHSGDELPVVPPQADLRESLVEMTAKMLGTTCVAKKDGRLLGIITDGDLRRLLETSDNPLDLSASEAMTPDPKHIHPEMLSAKALHIMEKHSITSLPVVDADEKLIGLIHMHDILKLETK